MHISCFPRLTILLESGTILSEECPSSGVDGDTSVPSPVPGWLEGKGIWGDWNWRQLTLLTLLRDDAVTRKNGVCPTGVFKKNVLCYTHFTVLYLSPKTQHITIKLQSWHRSKLTFSPAFCTPVTIYSTVYTGPKYSPNTIRSPGTNTLFPMEIKVLLLQFELQYIDFPRYISELNSDLR